MSDQEYNDVTRPSHYCHGGFEVKDVVDAVLKDSEEVMDGPCSWWYGNAVKYILRWPFKGSSAAARIRDLAKARECIDQLIDAYSSIEISRAFENRIRMGVDDEH